MSAESPDVPESTRPAPAAGGPPAGVPSTAYLQAVLESAVDGIAVVAADGTIHDVNGAALGLLGGTDPRALHGRSVFDVVPPDARDRLRAVLAAALAGEGTRLEQRLDAPGGARILDVRVAPIRDADGRVLAALALATDVTARHAAEAERRESEALVEAVFAEGSAMAWTWDLATDVVRRRGTLVERLGYADGTAPPDGAAHAAWWLARVHADDAPAIGARAAAVRRGTLPDVEAEYRFRRADGTYATLGTRLRVVADADGRPLRAVGMAWDVSARVDLETRLRHAQRMEAIGQLAGGVAHDFNNLLTAVRGNAELADEALGRLAGHVAADAPPAVRADVALLRELTAEIGDAAQRAAGITRQLLAFGRQQVLPPTHTTLRAIVHEALPLVRRLLGPATTVAPRLGDGRWLVAVNPAQFTQVLLNLVVNARDAMRDLAPGAPRRLDLVVAEVEVAAPGTPGAVLPDAEGRCDPAVAALVTRALGADAPLRRDTPDQGALPPGRYAVLLVRDSGHGMDAATRARVFEPFFTTKPVGEGSGLGLATVYGIVRQSRGHVFVDSEPGRGTAFAIYLSPAVEADAAPGEAAPDATATVPGAVVPDPGVRVAGVRVAGVPAASGPRAVGGHGSTARHAGPVVLLAEDEPGVRRMVRRALERHGCTVLGAADGGEALAAWAAARTAGLAVDVLLSDLGMPVLDGRALLARLRAEAPGLAAVLVTGACDETASPAGEPIAGVEWLEKPFTPDALWAAVRRALPLGAPLR